MPKGTGTRGTGEIVRDYLDTVPSASLYQIWAKLREECVAHTWHYPAYDHFRKYFWKLKKLKLVIEDHKEVIDRYQGYDIPGHPNYESTRRTSDLMKERWFYKINKKKKGSEDWLNPQKALYGK